MKAECTAETLAFQEVPGRAVVGRFDGGTLTSDGLAVLLREVERATGIIAQFAACFQDHRDPTRVQHSVAALVRRRIYALALGHEDLNDHDALRHDPLLAVLAEATDLAAPLAGTSTLNRLELSAATVAGAERYKKISVDHAAVDRMLLEVFVQVHPTAPAEIVLDLDATDDPVHGTQEGRFFHGYNGHYCYLPLYIFAGQHLLCARLRAARISRTRCRRVERSMAGTHARQCGLSAVQLNCKCCSASTLVPFRCGAQTCPTCARLGAAAVADRTAARVAVHDLLMEAEPWDGSGSTQKRG